MEHDNKKNLSFPTPIESNKNSKANFPSPVKKIKKYNLEVLNIAEIIDRSLSILIDNAKEYILLSLILYGPIVFFWFSYAIIFPFLNLSKSSELIFTGCLGIFGILIAFLGIFSIVLLMASVTNMTSKFYLGNKIKLKEALKESLKHFLPLLGSFILVGLIFFLVAIPFIMVIVFFFTLKNILGAILGVILFISLILVEMYIVFSYNLVPAIVVLENMSGLKALQRSRKLFHSNWDTIVKVSTIPILVNLLSQIFTSLPYIGVVLFLFFVSAPYVALTLIYYDVIIQRESFDLEKRIEQKLKG